MALHYDFTQCADTDAIKADTPEGWPVTDCTIWLCMIVGIDKITDANAEAFWHRVHAWETVSGPINTSGRPMEPRDIALRVGLRTNASRITDAAWRKKLTETMRRDSDSAWRRTAGGTLSRATLDAEAAE